MLISPRGFPLGEHWRVGPCDDALFGELVHVPWMMQFPRKGVRSHCLKFGSWLDIIGTGRPDNPPT